MNREIKHKKILFCASFTPPVNAGGGKNAYNFARFLSDRGYRVTLLSLNRRGKLPSRSRSGDLYIRRILYFNQNIFTKLISLFLILPCYLYYLCKNDIVFIYGGNIIGYELIILFARLFRKKIVFQSLLNYDDDIETLVKQRSLGRIKKPVLKKITVYFSLNRKFTEAWLKICDSPEKIFESPQGVNTEIFYPGYNKEKNELRKLLGLPEDRFIIITIGYVLKRKGFNITFDLLSQVDIPFHYVIVGNYNVSGDHYLAPFNREMEELYHLGRQKLKDNITFTGPQENIAGYLLASNVFLLNSSNEGLPNALLEAMACGLPCIVRDLPGHYDLIAEDRENILLAKDPQEIIDLIRELFENTDTRERIGTAAVKTIKEKASFHVVWENLSTKL